MFNPEYIRALFNLNIIIHPFVLPVGLGPAEFCFALFFYVKLWCCAYSIWPLSGQGYLCLLNIHRIHLQHAIPEPYIAYTALVRAPYLQPHPLLVKDGDRHCPASCLPLFCPYVRAGEINIKGAFRLFCCIICRYIMQSLFCLPHRRINGFIGALSCNV